MAATQRLLKYILSIEELIAKQSMMVSVEEAQAVVREIERTDSFMPFFDPSGYLKIRATMPEHLKLAKAFLAFRTILDELGYKDEE